MTVRKEDYEAWLKMDMTKQVFRLWDEYVKEVNEELLEGNKITDSAHVTMINYASIIGYNKMLREIKELSYEQLVGENEYVEQEDANEKAN